ncbi:uncharacterized protein tespa1 isoform X2 [Salminus brasiliensis]|uniref:uncharacterized protein tespa1 isoform X2 n=1 Tax=Salminus brasiliensis TaxID=930266 RepID=UPI003B82FA2C
MESPSSVGRRQAWVHSSRRWLPLADTEPQSTKSSCTPQPQHLSLQDEVFIEGCTTGKIETWLQGCGNEGSPESNSQLTVESFLKTASSFEDDLTLGAEATALDVESHTEEFGHCPLLLPPPKSRKDFHTSTPQQRLSLPLCNMGHSMASSAFSSGTSKTASSVSDVLQMCAEDAEETLYQLGFGCEEPQVTARIPARFFTFPSQLRGINFRLFLESQLRRIREEDPSLSLASRFRQVEVLTAMANAFYSLYSHVSRTPLQKLAPPEFSFSSPTVERNIGQRFFGSVRSEPRSPVERLKDTVSKMCLYTGSRGSDSASPNSSPRKRNSLPDVVGMVLETAKNDGGLDQGRGAWLQEVARNMAEKTEGRKAVQIAEVNTVEKVTNPHKERIQRWSQSGQRDSPRAKACLFKPEHESTHTQDSRNATVVDKGSTCSTSRSATLNKPVATKPTVAIITYDAICPQVVECVHQAPYRSPQIDNTAAVGASPVVQIYSESSSSGILEPKDKPTITDTQPQVCSSAEESDGHLMEASSVASQEDPASPHSRISQNSPCRIMVTGLDGDTTSIPKRDSCEDLTSSRCSGSTPQSYLFSIHNRRYLSPIKPPASQIKQANSFELEEVQSAGEEENISAEQCGAHTLSVVAATPQKCSPLRGDSFQSDSSGYAEEDMQQHSLAIQNREIS